MNTESSLAFKQNISIPGEGFTLEGDLTVPDHASGVVLFAHGSGSSRRSPRNRFVAEVLQDSGIGTLLFDLLTVEEDTDYSRRFDIALLTERLLLATQWLGKAPEVSGLPLGYFGASTGAAAALEAAAVLGEKIRAVVSRGGRPDLAMAVLERVQSPTLLIVGGRDETVLEWNREALERLSGPKALKIVPGATHLFEEAGTLEQAADSAKSWFLKYF